MISLMDPAALTLIICQAYHSSIARFVYLLRLPPLPVSCDGRNARKPGGMSSPAAIAGYLTDWTSPRRYAQVF
ncbi:hypothetical protein SCP_0108610 [Sparassis crispa]|uniref:Uncharacterized protein n=1 Tax=Sparassis crispa TaxID=139825 RepID=A0A401G750_9APHY|nr:hypothetical protein SCP_0108610 [Sparassis crispa]GBE77979.1 hypothetical protein SCP_0108610 [Sparassis crispa]